MPINNNVHIETLTAGGGTANWSMSSLATLYVIQGTATLTSSWTIQPQGLPVLGTIFKIKYEAAINLSGNTITIFGQAMPETLVTKTHEITCYYDGVDWEVNFIPDIMETESIPYDNIAPGDVEFTNVLTSHTTANGNNSPVLSFPIGLDTPGHLNSRIFVRDIKNENCLEVMGSCRMTGVDETTPFLAGSDLLFLQTDFLGIYNTHQFRGTGLIKTPTTVHYVGLEIECGGTSPMNADNDKIKFKLTSDMLGVSTSAQYDFIFNFKIPY